MKRRAERNMPSINGAAGQKIVMAVVLILVGVVIGYLVQGLVRPVEQLPTGDTAKPVNANKLESTLADYLTLYYGLVNISILNKQFNDGIWTVDLFALSLEGLSQFQVKISDSNLTVTSFYQKIPLRKTPSTLEEIPKKISCSQDDKVAVDIYIDPYDGWSARYDTYMQQFLTRFNSSVSPIWRIVPTQSLRLANQGDNVDVALFYFECTKNSPDFSLFRVCFYEKYTEKNAVLNETEITDCLKLTSMNVSEVTDCTGEKASKALSEDESFGLSYLGTLETPTVIVDCRYKTWPLFVDKVVCYLYPDLKECADADKA